MAIFTASNGATVSETQYSEFKMLTVKTPGNAITLAGVHVDALREFFLSERDEELGRWRWPENPDWIVYPNESVAADIVRSFFESDGSAYTVHRRDTTLEDATHPAWRAARAYFEAHPERKPWEDAKHGEIWVMTVGVGPEMVTYVDRETNDFPRFIDPTDDMSYGPQSGFTAGRRIWPEGKDD